MKKFWKTTKKVAMYLWQLPQNMIGAFLCYFYYRDGDVYPWNEDCDIEINCYSKKMKGGVTLGQYIIVLDLYYARHEYGHTVLSKMLGPLYLLVIGIPSIIHAIFHKYMCKDKDYYHFYTERWANKLSDKYFKED